MGEDFIIRIMAVREYEVAEKVLMFEQSASVLHIQNEELLVYNKYIELPPNNSKSQAMTQRKIWKLQEDQILKELFEVRKIKKWSQISRIMEKNYGIDGRNGKQCRERYHNHLKGGIKKEKWSRQQQKYLVQLHAIHGNRWALISKLIQGRTENCVKNMLYSKLRKSIRQLNRFSYQYYRRTLKEIKISFIYRLIQFTENSYKNMEQDRSEQEIIALGLKNQILQLDYAEDQEIPESEKQKIKDLVEQIHVFKRMNQRFRGSHTHKSKPKKVVKIEAVEEEQQDLSEMEQSKHSHDHDKGQDDSHKSEQQNIKIEYDSKAHFEMSCVKPIVSAMDSISTNPQERKEPTTTLKPKFSIMQVDNLDSELSLLLVDQCLENPIQTEHQFLNLTPTPYHPQQYQDWNNFTDKWRNHFTCQ